jgi:hypothetical protein
MFLHRISGMHTVPHGGGGVTLPEDVVRWEANYTTLCYRDLN